MGENLGYVARGDNEVGRIMRVGHHLIVVVEVIVVAIDRLNAHDGHALGNTDAHTAILGFVTINRLDERAAFKRLFNLPPLHGLHRLIEGIKLVGVQSAAYVGGGDEAIGVLVLNVNLYLLAQGRLSVGLTESRERQYEVDGQERIDHDGYSFLPIHIHTPALWGVKPFALSFLLISWPPVAHSYPNRLHQGTPTRRNRVRERVSAHLLSKSCSSLHLFRDYRISICC